MLHPIPERAALLVVTAAALVDATGCAAGAPLLHPAHVLRSGQVSMGAGLSANFAEGPARAAVARARAATAATGAVSTPQQVQDFADGSLAYSLITTGLAPWVGARVGTGYDTEAGLTYTGRSVRIDGRYAIENASAAVSFGAGASGVLSHPTDHSGATVAGTNNEIPGLDASGISGWGFDVPIIAGYRSEDDLVQVWGGARGGYEQLGGDFTLRIDPDPTAVRRAPVSAHRWFAGGLVGVAVGIAPLWVAAELDVDYQSLEGSVAVDAAPAPPRNAGLQGVTLTPAGAVIAKF